MTPPDHSLPAVRLADWHRLILAEQVRAGRVAWGLRWAARWIARAPISNRVDDAWSAVPLDWLRDLLRPIAQEWQRRRAQAVAGGAPWYDCSHATMLALVTLHDRAVEHPVWRRPMAVGSILYPMGPDLHEALAALVLDGRDRLRVAVMEPQTGQEVTLSDHQWRQVREVRI